MRVCEISATRAPIPPTAPSSAPPSLDQLDAGFGASGEINDRSLNSQEFRRA
jgi:hypothetical protein